MKEFSKYVGLDVQKETIAVSAAEAQGGEVFGSHSFHGLFSAEARRKIRVEITREGIFLILYMAVCAMVLNIFMQTRSLEEGSKSFGFAVMLDGTAERPYVYRQLIPMIANRAADIIPKADQDSFVNYHLDKYHLKQQYFGKAKYANKDIENWTPTYAIKFHIAYLTIFFCLVGLAYSLRFLVGSLIQGSELFILTMPIFFLLLLPMSFMQGDFFYDFPELFFLGTLLLAAIKCNYKWWLLILPIAVLNKESNVLIPLLYLPILISNIRTRRAIANILISVIISLAIYFYIKYSFSGNAGTSVLWNLRENSKFWLTPGNYLLWNDFYAPMIEFPRGGNIIYMALLASLLMLHWKKTPAQIRNLLKMAFFINIPLYLMFSYIDEVRALSFTFLPAFLAASYSLNQLLDKPSS